MTVEEIAKVCHDANKSLCETQGDLSQLDFEVAPDWQRESAIKGVQFCLENPNAPASANHDSWMAQKQKDGWAYGETKDAILKTHPCMVSFEHLPKGQQAKDLLFKNVVSALSSLIVMGGV